MKLKVNATLSKKRGSFLLIELLVAMAIIALCAYPLLVPHFSIAQAERSSLEKRQLERLADQAYLEILEALYKNSLPDQSAMKPVVWKTFENSIEGEWEKPAHVYLGEEHISNFNRAYQISQVNLNNPLPDEKYRLLDINVIFKKSDKQPSIFNYRAIIELSQNK